MISDEIPISPVTPINGYIFHSVITGALNKNLISFGCNLFPALTEMFYSNIMSGVDRTCNSPVSYI